MNETGTLVQTSPLPQTLAGARLFSRRLMQNPAFRRSLPWLAGLLIGGAALVMWSALRTPEYRPLFAQLADSDKALVMTALDAGNFHARIDPGSGAVEVPVAEVATARIMLAGQGLPKSAPTGYNLLGDMPLGTSRAVEGARLRQAQESELAASVAAIDGVSHASVHLAVGETSVFIRDRAEPSASVFVQLAAGRSLGEAQVRAIVHLVAASVAGLAADRVSVVDQSGALLSGDPAGLSGESQRQLAYQARVEALFRQRIVTLLTPILGTGNFSTEVSADVDFTQSEATQENYLPANRALHDEQGSSSSEAAMIPARGIPGALSNTVPPSVQASAAPPPAAATATPVAGPRSESYARNFEVGKAVSVTRAAVGRLQRLSVAVVVRDAVLGKDARQSAQLADLVRSAIGFDARRGDIVTVAGRPFAAISDDFAPKWFETPIAHDGGLGMLLITGVAMLVFGVVRPLIRRRLSEAREPEAVGEDATVNAAIDYRLKLTQTRALVSEDVSRASAVVRQMIQADAA